LDRLGKPFGSLASSLPILDSSSTSEAFICAWGPIKTSFVRLGGILFVANI